MENLFFSLVVISFLAIPFFIILAIAKKNKEHFRKAGIAVLVTIVSFVGYAIFSDSEAEIAEAEEVEEVEETEKNDSEEPEVKEEETEEAEPEEELEQEELEQEEVEEAEIDAFRIEETDLFKEVYYPYASKEKNVHQDAVIRFLDTTDYTYTTDDLTNSVKVTDDNVDGDYVYIKFQSSELTEFPQIETVSYYLSELNLEINRTNYSENKEAKHDRYKTHVIGEKDKEVNSIQEQIDFLNNAINN